MYYSSATGNLKIKKDTQSLKFLLQKKGVSFEEVDMAQLDKPARDKIYDTAKSRDLPLLFVDGAPLGTYEDVQNKEESDELGKILGV